MKLPVGEGLSVLRQRTALMERADQQNHKRGQDIEVDPGRLILKDEATGTRYEVYISSGSLAVRSL